MIPFSLSYRPIGLARIELGQFSPYIDPVQVTGDSTPTTPPSAGPLDKAFKTGVILGGVALLAFSAATAYVGISYGKDKRQTNIERAVGWTVGVGGVLYGLNALARTAGRLVAPTPATGRTV